MEEYKISPNLRTAIFVDKMYGRKPEHEVSIGFKRLSNIFQIKFEDPLPRHVDDDDLGNS